MDVRFQVHCPLLHSLEQVSWIESTFRGISVEALPQGLQATVVAMKMWPLVSPAAGAVTDQGLGAGLCRIPPSPWMGPGLEPQASVPSFVSCERSWCPPGWVLVQTKWQHVHKPIRKAGTSEPAERLMLIKDQFPVHWAVPSFSNSQHLAPL